MERQMKRSNADWIPEIPDGWEALPLKSAFKLGKGLSITKANLRDAGEPVISYGQIHAKDANGTSIKQNHIRYIDCDDPSLSDSSLAREGDIIVADTSEDLEGCGNAVYVNMPEVYAGYHCVLLRNAGKVNGKFLAYQMQTDAWRSQIRKGIMAVKVYSVTQTVLSRTSIVVPPADEQNLIADFLDSKCITLDKLAGNLEAQIAKLDEYKKALITQAVTKGLDPDVPMKDSGVSWIGQMPEDWRLSKLKYEAQLSPKCSISSLRADDMVGYAPMECIKAGFFIPNARSLQSLPDSLTPFQEGDIVIAKVTPCFENGNIAVMTDIESGIGFGSSELFVMRATSIETRFLFYWLQGEGFRQEAISTMTGMGGLKRVSSAYMREAPIFVPATETQCDIVAYLDEKCAAIDSLKTNLQAKLTKLAEYKKSLIFDYVTGKKEVPESFRKESAI